MSFLQGAKDSEESKESGGDSQADVDTTDPEQSDTVAAVVSIGGLPPVRVGASNEIFSQPSIGTVTTVTSGPIVTKVHSGFSASMKEQSRAAFSRPTTGRSSDKK